MLSLNVVLELYDVRLQERGSGKEVRPIDQMSPVLQRIIQVKEISILWAPNITSRS